AEKGERRRSRDFGYAGKYSYDG
ncbi:hypothetical protein LCGC14_2395790, partial [marine sediment metagenome]